MVAAASERRALALHPAWVVGLLALPIALTAGWLFAHSTAAASLYAAAVADTPGAAIAGLAFGAPPPGI